MAYLEHACRVDNFGYNSWYQLCDCCPYGYHIDLDFVRYCESIGQQADRTGSIKRRRDRRRQRQSMEVLLGLEPPVLATLEKFHQKAIEEESHNLNQKQTFFIHDDLDEVVSDFERTLQRSKTKKPSNNLPDVTAVHDAIHRVPSISSMSSTSGSSMIALPAATEVIPSGEYDSISMESYGLSPLALQNIREQLALGLERTKELEEQVKLIPSLQAQLSVLKEEKRQLLLERKAAHNAELNVVNGNNINNSVALLHARLQSHSLTHSTSVESINKKEHRYSPVPRRDFGVMCSVLTRNVGVGHQPYTKSVATTTVNGELECNHGDRWLREKVKFLTTDGISTSISNISMNEQKVAPILVSKETQSPRPPQEREIGVQTISKPKVQSVDNFTQSFEEKKVQYSVGVLAKVASSSVGTETIVPTQSIGTSDDTIDGSIPTNCTDKNKIREETSSAISLASLSFPRSKSFHLGDDKLNLASQNRTIGCQYEPFISHRACQYELKTQSKTCQTDVKLAHKGVQYEYFSVAKSTDTQDLRVATKDIGCNTKVLEKQTIDVAVSASFGHIVTCAMCLKKDDEKFEKKDDSVTSSRIPRPLMSPTVEIRKFKRQNTYTKIPVSKETVSGLSGLDLNAKHDNELSSPLEKVKQNYKLSKIPSNSENGVGTSKNEQQYSTLSLPDSDLCQGNTQGHRKKVKPSKEMQAAMKVLNDSLQKGQTKNLKNQLKNAINIIQQEWFKISSLISADPLDVEDYLDCFEDISSDLLHYIVNMVDVSGNTAMHYAVSHGNFDVVSILLDSKVCDINQPNKAGYTSVMLVSLAEVCSPTHANVVRRLFQLADVNIRAKQHGQTALMLAVSHGRLDMVQMLLEAGAEINIQDEDGSTALMCASEHGHIEIVKHFLSQPDCDSTITDVDGSTALKIAMEAEHRHIGVLLYAHERNLHGGTKLKRHKSTSLTSKTPSSPLPMRSSHRALTDIKPSK